MGYLILFFVLSVWGLFFMFYIGVCTIIYTDVLYISTREGVSKSWKAPKVS